MTFGDNFKNLPNSFSQTNMSFIKRVIKEHNAKVRDILGKINSFSYITTISYTNVML